MRNGGYQIIDLKDTNLSSGVGVTISGIYDAIEGSYRKPLLLSGIVIENVEKNDVFICADLSGTTYSIAIYDGVITIADDNTVTYTAN